MKQFAFSTKDWAIRIGGGLLAMLLCQSALWGQSVMDEDFSGAKWSRKPITKLSDGTEPPGTLPTPGKILPHAGDYISNEKNYFEIVYMPLQTRIYAYSKKFKPVSAEDVRAQMTLQLPGESAARRVPFQFVRQPEGSTEQDFVAANFDIRPLQGKEASISFEVACKSDPTVMTPFYQHFSIRPYIAKAALTEADQDAIARQQNCPVTGAPLVGKKDVVKIYIAEYPLYLSGERCIAEVARTPQRFVPQAPVQR